MAEVYKTMSRQSSMLYLPGCPVTVLSGALLSDDTDGRVLAQLKLENIGTKSIRLVALSVQPLDASGQPKWNNVEYIYDSLKVGRGQDFGTDNFIVMPDIMVASYNVRIKEIIFTDGDRKSFSDEYLRPLPPRERLEKALGDEALVQQYRIVNGDNCIYYPSEQEDLWFCTCGAINSSSELKCFRCRRSYSALKSVNIQALKVDAGKRIEKEKQFDSEESLELAKKRSRVRKLIAIGLPIVLVLTLILATVPGYFIRKSSYSKAQTLLESGRYDDASAAFEKLGAYLDCQELVEKEIPYRKAQYILQCAREENTDGLVMLGLKRSEFEENDTVSTVLYAEASKMFDALGEYKDSAAMSSECLSAIEAYEIMQKEEAFSLAEALLTEEKYCEARDAFAALGDYSNASDMVQECISRKLSSLAALNDTYDMSGIRCRISLETGVKSSFFIPKDVYIKLGSGISADIRAACGNDGAELSYEEAPSEDCRPFPEALNQLLSDYGLAESEISADIAQEEPSGPSEEPSERFFDLCSAGDLSGALNYLSVNGSAIPGAEAFVNAVNFYLPFCGSWKLDEGNPALLPSAYGVQAQCMNLVSTVRIDRDGSAVLDIYPEGNRDYPISLTPDIKSDGSVSFSVSPDGMNVFYVVLNNSGRLSISKYNIYAAKQANDSCTYLKAA